MLNWSNDADNARLLGWRMEGFHACEEDVELLYIAILGLQNSLTKACEIVGGLGNEHVRERNMSRLENVA